MISEPQPFDDALNVLRRRLPVGSKRKSEEWALQKQSVKERAFFSATIEDVRFLQRARDFILDYLEGNTEETEGGTALKADGRARFIRDMATHAIEEGLGPVGIPPGMVNQKDVTDIRSEARLKLIFDTQVKQSFGYGYWTQGMDANILDAYPAARFVRHPKGGVEKRPRHAASEGEVRLKTDTDWWAFYQNSTAIGGFAVPWPPYGFNSRMDQEDVDHDEAVELGLITDEQKLSPKTVEFNANLKASIKGLDPDLLARLEKELGVKASGGEIKPEPQRNPPGMLPVKTKASNFATSKKQLLDRAEVYRKDYDDLYITEQTKRDELKNFTDVKESAKDNNKAGHLIGVKSLAVRMALEAEGVEFHDIGESYRMASAPAIHEALKKPKLQAMRKARETAVFIAEKKRVEFIADKVFGAPESLTKNLLPVKRKGGAKRDDERRDVMLGILSRFAGQERMDALANNYKHDVKKGTRATHTGFLKDPTTGNAYVYANGFKSVGTIATDKDESLGTILHEYMHAVEHLDTEVLAKSITYRESRRAPGELDKRAEDLLGYDGNDPVLEDNWKLHKYAGKRYVDATGEPRNDRASEVLTMWATHVMNHFAFFIEEEPDYFWWGYKTLTELDQ